MTVANFIKAMNAASLELCYQTKPNVLGDPERLQALDSIIKTKEALKSGKAKPAIVEQVEVFDKKKEAKK